MKQLLLKGYEDVFWHLLCYAAVVLIAAYSWGPLLDAQWSIVDDHEIVATVGQNNAFSYADIPAALGKTEVASSSTAVRFRPSYYVLRFSEVAAWGANPGYWYATRVLIAIAFSLALAWVCLQLASPVLALGFLVFVLSRPFWLDIFGRLGPAETYGALGISMVILAVSMGVGRSRSLLWALILSLGVVIAAGSKENLLFLTIIPILILFFNRKDLSPIVRGVYLIPAFYAVWIVFTLWGRLKLSGKDVYAQEISLESRLGLVIHFLQRVDVLLWLGGIALILLTICALKLCARRMPDGVISGHSKALVTAAFLIAIFLALFFFQYVFYSGRWPDVYEPRYLFPGIIFKYLAVLVILNCAVKLLSRPRVAKFLSYGVSSLAFVCFIGVLKMPDIGRNFPEKNYIELSGYGYYPDIASNRFGSEARVRETVEFTKAINSVADYLKGNPTAWVVFNSHGGGGDYEPLFSIERFLRAAGVSAPIALNFDGYSVDSFPDNPLATELIETLDDLRNGRAFDKNGRKIPERHQNMFTTIERMGVFGNCFSLGFSGVPLSRCEMGSQIWP